MDHSGPRPIFCATIYIENDIAPVINYSQCNK